jgi:pyruvate-formate lyase
MIDVRKFIQENYTEFTEQPAFLCGPTCRTRELFEKVKELLY